MLIGHYAPALMLRSVRPQLPLWMLFVAVQLVDYAWAVLILLGVERAHVSPGFTDSNGLVLEYMPFTHGLGATAIWAVGAGALAAALWKVPTERVRVGALVGLAVASHWLLDVTVHVADLPLWSGDGVRVGLGLWSNRLLAFGLELGLVVVGLALYARRQCGRRFWTLAGAMVFLTVASYFGPQPVTITSMATTAFGLYTIVAQLAAWSERPLQGPR